jgi:hypothetical protein
MALQHPSTRGGLPLCLLSLRERIEVRVIPRFLAQNTSELDWLSMYETPN